MPRPDRWGAGFPYESCCFTYTFVRPLKGELANIQSPRLDGSRLRSKTTVNATATAGIAPTVFIDRHWYSSGELGLLLESVLDYKLTAFQTRPGNCYGFFKAAWVSPDCMVISHGQSIPVLISGKRSAEWSLFCAALPINAAGREETPYFWKNMAMTNQLIGGFSLSETQAHYKMSENCIGLHFAIRRSALLKILDKPEMRCVLEYLQAANSCLVPQRVYDSFVRFSLQALCGFKTTQQCPLLRVIDVLMDSSFAHALPSRQLLPSSSALLDKTKDIHEAIGEGMNVADLAKITKLGRTQLNAACQEVYGCSPKEFVRSFRLEEAMILLRSPAMRGLKGLSSVADVHQHVGWSSSSSFRKAFGDWYGRKPSDCWVEAK